MFIIINPIIIIIIIIIIVIIIIIIIICFWIMLLVLPQGKSPSILSYWWCWSLHILLLCGFGDRRGGREVGRDSQETNRQLEYIHTWHV